MALLLLPTLLLHGCKDKKKEGKTTPHPVEYESMLFDTSFVHKVDVDIAEEDWADLLENPTEKTKYHVDITIDGEKVKDVSFATKGNSSLIFVAADPDSDRYSYKVSFGQYVEGQTYHGLDKFNLTNQFSDATNMKDHLSYELFRKMGVPAPLSSFVWLRVNGEDRGLYLAVEDTSESFLERNFGGEGVIYKPESDDVAVHVEDVPNIIENGLNIGGEYHGAKLDYISDRPEDYPDIFDHAETEQEEEDKLAVTEEIARFFAVHNFILNLDSYTGIMLHNVVLYENKSRLEMLPWDYNLAYMTFILGSGQEVLEDPTNFVNQGIDTPLVDTRPEDRPMWAWIVEDDTYRKAYHDAFDVMLTEYFESGVFDRAYDETIQMILPYVEKDPTAFFTLEEFKNGSAALKRFCKLRAESIRRQLDGKLPTDSTKQAAEDKIDASDLNVMEMGATVLG